MSQIIWSDDGQRAILAIAHKILVAAYNTLAKGLPYRQLAEAYLDQIAQTRTVANLKRRIHRLGYNQSPRGPYDALSTLKLFSWQRCDKHGYNRSQSGGRGITCFAR
jgi:hypothetical protein